MKGVFPFLSQLGVSRFIAPKKGFKCKKYIYIYFF
jgi:hypothetical protein